MVDRSPMVRISTGQLIGRSLGQVDAYLGVPYAEPPVGALRWRPPQPPARWTGVREATDFSASAWQVLMPEGFGPWTQEFVVSGPVSEDCLYLNVWTPSERTAELLPVLVWIHGGGFVQGSGSVPIYDGQTLANQGVVVVSLNYRLGVFGFLAHPELARESEVADGYGNFGLLDQMAALRWVQENISAFGGDPDAVTLAGQSAGAVSVHMLAASIRAEGLFQRAIAMSGPPELVAIPTRAQSEAVGLDFAAKLQQSTLQGLRALSVEELTQALSPGMGFWPMVDGHVLPDWPPGKTSDGWARPVPMIVSLTADENSGLDPDYGSVDPACLEALLQRYVGSEAPAWRELYWPHRGTEVARAYREASRDRWLAALWHWLRERGGYAHAPVYLGLFGHAMPGPHAERFGAFHTSDVPYAMGTLARLSGRHWTGLDLELSELICGYWLDFVRTGNPNSPKRQDWPMLLHDAPHMLHFGQRTFPQPMFSDAVFAAVRSYLDRTGQATVLA